MKKLRELVRCELPHGAARMLVVLCSPQYYSYSTNGSIYSHFDVQLPVVTTLVTRYQHRASGYQLAGLVKGLVTNLAS